MKDVHYIAMSISTWKGMQLQKCKIWVYNWWWIWASQLHIFACTSRNGLKAVNASGWLHTEFVRLPKRQAS